MALKTIAFDVASAVPPGSVATVLRDVEALEGVHRVVPVAPGAQDPDLRRMFSAYVHEEADPDAVRAAVASIQGVASASLPPERRLPR